jgi:hypothetical protein
LIKVFRANISKFNISQFVCVESNSTGLLRSNSSKIILQSFGKKVEDESILVCNKSIYLPGDIYTTNCPETSFKKIVYLVTTKFPNDKVKFEDVEKCLLGLIAYCKMMKIDSISLPRLGNLDIFKTIDLFKKVLLEEKINFNIIDNDPIFVYQFNEQIK